MRDAMFQTQIVSMEADTWQTAYEAAVRLHRSIEAEVGDFYPKPPQTVLMKLQGERVADRTFDS